MIEVRLAPIWRDLLGLEDPRVQVPSEELSVRPVATGAVEASNRPAEASGELLGVTKVQVRRRRNLAGTYSGATATPSTYSHRARRRLYPIPHLFQQRPCSLNLLLLSCHGRFIQGLVTCPEQQY